MKTEDLYRHKCSVTGKGMNEGWYIDGEYYSTIELADIEAQKLDFKDFEELYDECENEGEQDYCYWTTWEDDLEEEEEAYDEDGNLYTFEGGKWNLAFDLEDYEIVGGDGIEMELWKHKTTKQLIHIPIEIVRDFDNIIFK